MEGKICPQKHPAVSPVYGEHDVCHLGTGSSDASDL